MKTAAAVALFLVLCSVAVLCTDTTDTLRSPLAFDLPVTAAKTFIKMSKRSHVRRGWWPEQLGESEEEEEEEPDREMAMWMRCAPTCWGSWSAYGDCTSSCGNNGYQTAHRFISPPPACVDLVVAHGCPGTDQRTLACNRMCYNGGTPRDGWCSCMPWFQGNCCETRFCIESGTELDPNGTSCLLCMLGTYRDATVHDQCEACPVGWTTPELGARTRDQCTVRYCESGSEFSPGGTCQNCSVGSFRDAAVDPACKSCPRHWITANPGAMSAEDCALLHCEAGFEGLLDDVRCTPCPVGSFKNYVGCGLCSPCTSGYTTTRMGSMSVKDCSMSTKLVAIVGGSVGGFVLVLLIMSTLVCCRERKRTDVSRNIPDQSVENDGTRTPRTPSMHYYSSAGPINDDFVFANPAMPTSTELHLGNTELTPEVDFTSRI